MKHSECLKEIYLRVAMSKPLYSGWEGGGDHVTLWTTSWLQAFLAKRKTLSQCNVINNLQSNLWYYALINFTFKDKVSWQKH